MSDSPTIDVRHLPPLEDIWRQHAAAHVELEQLRHRAAASIALEGQPVQDEMIDTLLRLEARVRVFELAMSVRTDVDDLLAAGEDLRRRTLIHGVPVALPSTQE